MTAPNSPSLTTVENATDAVLEVPGVRSVAIRPPGDGHEYGNRYCVEMVFAQSHGRISPRLLSCLAENDLGIADVSPQGDQLVVAAV